MIYVILSAAMNHSIDSVHNHFKDTFPDLFAVYVTQFADGKPASKIPSSPRLRLIFLYISLKSRFKEKHTFDCNYNLSLIFLYRRYKKHRDCECLSLKIRVFIGWFPLSLFSLTINKNGLCMEDFFIRMQ